MKILLIQNTLGDPSLALTKYLIETAKVLKSTQGISEVVIVTGEPELELEGIKCIAVKGSPYSIKGNLIFILDSVRRILNLRLHFDVVHVLYPSTSLVASYIYKALHSSKMIYELRSPWVEMGLSKKYSNSSAIFTRLFAFSLESFTRVFADGYIFISEGLYRYYTKSFFPDTKPNLIFPSATNFEIDVIPVSKGDIRKLVHLGSLEATRKIGSLVSNFAELVKIYPDVTLDFIGDGDDIENLKKLVDKLHLNNSISFLGRVPPGEVGLLLSNYQAGITHLPPRKLFQFSSPLKNYEYLSLGLRLLLSEVAPNEEFVHRGFGKLYYYNDPIEFIKAFKDLQNLSLNPDKVKAFLKEHTYEANGEKIVKFYHTI